MPASASVKVSNKVSVKNVWRLSAFERGQSRTHPIGRQIRWAVLPPHASTAIATPVGAANGAGSGCSVYESKPSWKTDSGCSRRTVADVSAAADPATGASVYDSYGYQELRGW